MKSQEKMRFFFRATASNTIICEDFDEITGVEGGVEEPFPYASLVVVCLCEMESKFPDEQEVLRGVALHCHRVVLKEGHVEMPMEEVLYAPVASGENVVVGGLAEGLVAVEVPCCLGRLARFLEEIRKM